jgi:molybdopterin-binding protein
MKATAQFPAVSVHFPKSNHRARAGLTANYIASDIVKSRQGPLFQLEGTIMKISARNALPGKIVDIKKGATTAHVRIDVNGTIVTASIINESVEDLGLKVGDKVHAVIKSSDVMVAIP